jgi:hypothetical protein
MRAERLRATILALASLLFVVAWSGRADAYPWMIRHGYASCATCHVDPSGAALLTEYGRAQSEVLLSTRWRGDDAEASGLSGPFFGALPASEIVTAGGWIRNGVLAAYSRGSDGSFGKSDARFLAMRAELAAHLSIDRLRAYATIGASDHDASVAYPRALLTNGDGWNAVAREHWIGVAFGADGEALLRAGRMSLPFGLRIVEHTAFVRSETRTDFDQSQQDGIAFAASAGAFRGEGMLVLGNHQVSPDKYRDRGVSGYVEWHPEKTTAIGASTSVLHASSDVDASYGGAATTRQAHGLFARAAPLPSLALLAEVDALITTVAGDGTHAGVAAFVQADDEIASGVHLLATGELLAPPRASATTVARGWLGAAWFVVTHVDLRVDVIAQPSSGGAPATLTLLGQGNIYL